MSGQDSLIGVGSGNGEPHMKSKTNDNFKTHAVISERFKIIQHRFIADDRPQRCKASIICFTQPVAQRKSPNWAGNPSEWLGGGN